MSDKLRAMLLRHEGLRLYPYLDSVGKWTIGVGHCLTDNGITHEESEFILKNDIAKAENFVRSIFPNMDSWAMARQDALVDMMFNVGFGSFCGFKNMISAIKAGAWKVASEEMLNSKWAKQVPTRAQELAKMVETGEY